MHGFSIEAVSFLAVVWSFAFASSLVRSLADPDARGFGRIIAFACTSGFVAIGVIGLLCGDPRSAEFNWIYYVAIAALIGGSGKEQDKYARSAVRRFVRAFQASIDVEEKQ